MKQQDPKASWLQMTWLFYFDRKHWTNPRIDAFVNAIPKDKMILLDYFCRKLRKYGDRLKVISDSLIYGVI